MMSTRNKIVFLSSTSEDLAEYRKAIYEAVSDMEGYDCKWMEGSGAMDCKPLDYCRRQVTECDLFIMIVGHRHGSCPKGSNQSYTEIEYETALSIDKSRIIFLASDDFKTSDSVREPDEKHKLQRALRERAAKERVIYRFRKKKDLATRVVTGINNWAQDQIERRDKQGQPRKGLGEEAFKTCDRSEQKTRFNVFFHKNLSSGRPHIYLLLGETKDCPESLVDRLVIEDINSKAESMSKGDVLTTPYHRFPDWQYDDTPDDDPMDPITQVKMMLHMEFRPSFSPEELSANALDKLICSQVDSEGAPPSPIVVLRHSIALSRWNAVSRNMFKAYMDYWAEMVPTASSKRFLIFINFWYPEAQTCSWWKSLFAPGQFDRKSFETELRRVLNSTQGRCHPLILNLTPVYEHHVLSWFQDNTTYLQAVIDEKAKKFFTDEKGRTIKERRMDYIEKNLRNIVEEIRRGV